MSARCRHGRTDLNCSACEEIAERRAEGDEQAFDVESDKRGTPAERRYERFAYGEGS